MNRTFSATPVALDAAALASHDTQLRKPDSVSRLEQKLLSAASSAHDQKISFANLKRLPTPVARYFQCVLRDGQPSIRVARFSQSGQLRTSAHSRRWMTFDAHQTVVPGARGFLWEARAGWGDMRPLHIVDNYQAGFGLSQARLWSTFTLSSHRGGHELQAGALHRYLAEAVWYPTALLPSAGVKWTAIDDRRALATLSDVGVAVSLEFRFAESGEVSGIYTPGRWRNVDGSFCLTPWEGRFGPCIELAGMRVPANAEVGWYIGGYTDGQWRAVWRGEMTSLIYEWGA
jgi:hypothetical protein